MSNITGTQLENEISTGRYKYPHTVIGDIARCDIGGHVIDSYVDGTIRYSTMCDTSIRRVRDVIILRNDFGSESFRNVTHEVRYKRVKHWKNTGMLEFVGGMFDECIFDSETVDIRFVNCTFTNTTFKAGKYEFIDCNIRSAKEVELPLLGVIYISDVITISNFAPDSPLGNRVSGILSHFNDDEPVVLAYGDYDTRQFGGLVVAYNYATKTITATYGKIELPIYVNGTYHKNYMKAIVDASTNQPVRV